MKKIVVVVRGEKIVFEGEKLDVIDSSGKSIGYDKILIIKEKGTNIAVFKRWDYWREVRKKDKTLKSKVLVRPKKSATAAMIRAFYESIRKSDVVVIPSDFQMIVLNALGEVNIL